MTDPSAPSGPTRLRPRLHVVVLSHLDTQWRWTAIDTARDFLPATVDRNEPLFARHPRYTLSFEGASRYRMLRDHHPERFRRLVELARQQRWYPAGAAVEAFDTLLPSPESLVRQILYGRRWFARELGRDSRDLFLPDCFGFPGTLPTLAAHCGLVGFSTQKLRRGPQMRAAHGIPFPYGRWRGPDGGEILAALDPGEYSGQVAGDLSIDPLWRARFAAAIAAGQPPILLTYVGIGDRGGAPPEGSIAELERSLDGAGPIEVRHGPSSAVFLETSADERAVLPVHDGELLLRLHGTGCYSAKSAMKRWNRTNERLARAAEAAAVAARIAGRPYPARRLEDAWWRFLGHQMHDDLTGTSIPAAYRLSLRHEALAANELAEIAADSIAAAARGLDLAGPGRRVVLFNPLGVERQELVEVELGDREPGGLVAVLAPDGDPIPAQRSQRSDGKPVVLFSARLRGLGLAVYRIVPTAGTAANDLRVDERSLDNGRLRAGFDAEGNLATLVDLRSGQELLGGPAHLELYPNRSRKYPAWEIRFEDLDRPPRARFEHVSRREVLDRGPVRVALAIEREAEGSRVREVWSLAAGPAGDRLECAVTLDWRGRASLLKSVYRFAGESPSAIYDDGIGAVRRPVSCERLYEVPAQHWAALDDRERGFGLAVLSDRKQGWDHPDSRTLRLTWIHAPSASFKWRHQRTQDQGRHRFRIALAPIAAEPVAAGIPQLADRFANPPLAYRLRDADPACEAVPSEAEPRKQRQEANCSIEGTDTLLQAWKCAEEPAGSGGEAVGDLARSVRIIARFRNPTEQVAAAKIRTTPSEEGQSLQPAAHWTGAELLDGCEVPLDDSSRAPAPEVSRVPDGAVRIDVPARSLATVALDLALPRPDAESSRRSELEFLPVPLYGGLSVFSSRSEASSEGFDGRGTRFPRELIPARVDDSTVPFELAPLLATDGPGAFGASGQALELPAGFVELWLLGASVAGAVETEIEVGNSESRTPVRLVVPDWRAPLFVESRCRSRLLGGGIVPEVVRRVPLAWVAPFLRDRHGRDLYFEPGMLFALRVPLAGARQVRLPVQPALRFVAATLARSPARPLVEAGDFFA